MNLWLIVVWNCLPIVCDKNAVTISKWIDRPGICEGSDCTTNLHSFTDEQKALDFFAANKGKARAWKLDQSKKQLWCAKNYIQQEKIMACIAGKNHLDFAFEGDFPIELEAVESHKFREKKK